MITPEFSTQKINTKTVVKTTKPKLADLNYTSNITLLKDFSDYLDQIIDIENQINVSLAYYNSLQSGDPVTDISEFFIDLNDNKFVSLDNEYIEFWSKRYDSLIQPIKDKVKEKISNKKNYLENISDSIGTLVNTENKLDDSVTPIYDLYCSIYGAPNYIPVQLRNKISPTTSNLTKDLSQKTTALMRTNLRNVYFVSSDTPPYVDATTSHGLNLVPDYKYYISYTQVFSNVFLRLIDLYSATFTYIQYFNNIANGIACNLRDIKKSNLQKIDNAYFAMDVEGTDVNMDFFQNKIKDVRAKQTIKKVLSNMLTSAQEQSTQSANRVPSVQNLAIPAAFDQIPEISSKLSDGLSNLNVDITKYITSFTDQLGINKFIPGYQFSNIIPAEPITNSIFSAIQMPNIPNFLPSQDNALLSQLTNIASQGNNIPGLVTETAQFLLPNTIGTSLNDAIGLINGGLPSFNDPMSIFNTAQQIKGVICNFVPPNFNISDFPNFNFNVSFDDIANKLLSVLPKFDFSGLGNIDQTLEKTAKDFGDRIVQSFNNFIDGVAKC
jgi:hypothetical protein